MAYGEIYYHTYCTPQGMTCRVSLQERDYSGVATEVDAATTPFIKTLENSDMLKKGGVFPSTATVTFVGTDTFNLETLYTADESKYRIVHTVDGEQDWIGNVIPNGFYESRHGENRALVITASDRLTVLQGILFTQADGTNYGLPDGDFEQTFIWAVAEALKKTGLLLPIWTMVDLKPLFTSGLVEVEQEMIRWAGNELRDNPPSSPERNDELMGIFRPGKRIQVTDGPYEGEIYTVVAVRKLPISSTQVGIAVTTAEFIPSGVTFDRFEVYSTGQQTGVVLARRGHFNDVAPSEIGIFKEGADLSFVQSGDTVKITDSQAGNDGVYTVIGTVHSVPPDSPYIRIQLSPQVPVQIHENVIVEIISNDFDQPDPLSEATHDVRTWINEADEIDGQNYFEQRQTAKTAWEVLDAIARQFNARVTLNGDHWEVSRWNAYKVNDGVYQWFVYNSEGTLIGRRPFGETKTIPCDNTGDEYELFGSQIGMDRVLKNVNVNYRYKYKVEGDNLHNLIRNGGFGPWEIPGVPPMPAFPAFYTPRDWKRVDSATGWQQPPYMNITLYDTPFALPSITDPDPPDYPPGADSFAEFQGVPHSRVYLSSYTGYDTSVLSGDVLNVSWWQSSEWLHSGSDDLGTRLWEPAWLVLRIIVINPSDPTDWYMLVNAFDPNLNRENPVQWVKYTDKIYNLVSGPEGFVISPAFLSNTMSEWKQVAFKTPPAPINGNVLVEIVGAGVSIMYNQFHGVKVHSVPWFSPTPEGGSRDGLQLYLTDARVRLSGVAISKVVDTANEAVPQLHGYTYPDPGVQRTREYTDTLPDIEILTGDDDDPDHVSVLKVNGVVASKWDTWQNEFGWGAMGLTLAKSVMEQYWKPWRLLEGTFSVPGIDWSTTFMLEDRPGEKYMILRGAIDPSRDMFSGTLAQITETGLVPLPPGGGDGGNTTDPKWEFTGATRCARGTDGLNTGMVEALQVDNNPASATYGQERWLETGEDATMCPIGEPIDILWGEQATLNPASLRTQPYEKNGGRYTVQFSNNGAGAYLRLLHRASLGTVQSILYPGGYESISGWVYEPDVNVGGYTYKHLRLSWLTGVYSNLPVIFVIN